MIFKISNKVVSKDWMVNVKNDGSETFMNFQMVETSAILRGVISVHNIGFSQKWGHHLKNTFE